MTRQDVNQLVADTKWAYLTSTEYAYKTTNAPDTSQSSRVELSVESESSIYDFESSKDSFAVIGCRTANGYSRCESFNKVSVSYFEGKVYKIRIFSEKSAYKYPDAIHDFVEMTVTAITKKYGKPSKKWPTDYTESALILLKDDEELNAALWQWPSETKKVKPTLEIFIRVDKDPTDYGEKYPTDYKTYIDLVDKKAEGRYLEAERIEYEKYLEEERHPRVETDF